MFDKKKLSKIAKKYDLLVLVLFGSYAKGLESENSDYDVAYYSRKPLKNKFELWNEIETLFDKRVDLIEINSSDSVILRNQIFTSGICLYELRRGLFDELASKSFFDYVDSKSYIDEFSSIIKKSIEEM